MSVQDLMSGLIQRIDEFQHGDRDAVLGSGVPADVAELERQARSAADELPADVRQVLGWLSWCRYLALPAGQDQDEFRAAFVHFACLVDTHPDVIPVQLRELLASTDTPGAGQS